MWADSVGDVVDDDGGGCSSVVHRRETVIALLSRATTAAAGAEEVSSRASRCATHLEAPSQRCSAREDGCRDCCREQRRASKRRGVGGSLMRASIPFAAPAVTAASATPPQASARLLWCPATACWVLVLGVWSSYLSRCVPDLELDDAVRQLNGLREEGGADGGLLVLEELLLHEAQHQRTLAHGAVTQQHLTHPTAAAQPHTADDAGQPREDEGESGVERGAMTEGSWEAEGWLRVRRVS